MNKYRLRTDLTSNRAQTYDKKQNHGTVKQRNNMEEKEILLKVPQGKKAEWNEEGYLHLVDEEQPKDITERIKTFNDACLMTEGKTEEEWSEENETEKMDADVLAFLKLRIICAALNEGWEPQFTEDEWPWYPWFLLWTEDELADKDDDWKTSHCLRAINDRRTTYAGFAFAYADYAPQHTYTFFDSRLCLKRKVLADYCGHQFIDLWLDYCLPKK